MKKMVLGLLAGAVLLTGTAVTVFALSGERQEAVPQEVAAAPYMAEVDVGLLPYADSPAPAPRPQTATLNAALQSLLTGGIEMRTVPAPREHDMGALREHLENFDRAALIERIENFDRAALIERIENFDTEALIAKIENFDMEAVLAKLERFDLEALLAQIGNFDTSALQAQWGAFGFGGHGRR